MITILSIILVIIGGLNWFSVGVFDFNFVDWIFGAEAYIGARIVYGIVGVAALWLVVYLIANHFSGRRINAIECMRKKDTDKHVVSEITETTTHDEGVM